MGVTSGGEEAVSGSGALSADPTRPVTVIVNSDWQQVFDDSGGYYAKANGLLGRVKKVWCANQKVNAEDVIFCSQHRKHTATIEGVEHPMEVKDTDTPDSLGVVRELHLWAVTRPMAREAGGLCAVPFNPIGTNTAFYGFEPPSFLTQNVWFPECNHWPIHATEPAGWVRSMHACIRRPAITQNEIDPMSCWFPFKIWESLQVEKNLSLALNVVRSMQMKNQVDCVPPHRTIGTNTAFY